MRRGGSMMVAVAALTLGACGGENGLGDELLGTWALAAYDDHGDVATTTGTWSFYTDATFSVLGTLTFPGEPTDSLDVIGTWREQGTSAVAMTVGDDTTIWQVTLAPDTAVIELPDAEGTVRITLTK